MKQLKLSVSPRTEKGRGPMRRLRAQGQIPAVIYGPSGSRSLSVKSDDFRMLMRSIGGAAALVEVTEEGQSPVMTVIADAQRCPTSDRFKHIDFHEVSANKLMHATLPIHLTGEAIGVKTEDGILDFQSHTVSIRCLPKDLPEFIEVDVSALHVGQAIHIKELPQVAGVTYLGEPETAIVACAAQRLSGASDAEASAEAEAGAEGKNEG